jgi:hypothetical protein
LTGRRRTAERTDGDDAWGVDVDVDVFVDVFVVVVRWWSGASVVRTEGARRRRRWAALDADAETEAESACARDVGSRTTPGRRGDVW